VGGDLQTLPLSMFVPYNQTCLKEVTFGTKKKWPYKTGDLFYVIYTVKPVLRGPLWDKEKVFF
jgi:hypothetical protein